MVFFFLNSRYLIVFHLDFLSYEKSYEKGILPSLVVWVQ